MKRLFAFALAAICSGGILAADSYTFTAGTEIPLREDGSTAGYVSTSGTISVDEYTTGSAKYGATLTVKLNNQTAGDYVLFFKGSAKGFSNTYTVTVTDGGDYTRSATITQNDTKGYDKWQDASLLLDGLPAGELTLTNKATSRGDNWDGNYGYYVFKSKASAANDITDSSGTALALKTVVDNGIVVLTGTGINCSEKNEIGNVRDSNTMQFSLCVGEEAKYKFDYSVATYDNYPTVTWTLIGSNVNTSFSDEIGSTGSWDTYTNCTHSLGILPKGAYILKASINTGGRTWGGNFKDFVFTMGAKPGTVAAGATLTLTEDTEYATLDVGAGATIDLNGHNLTVGSATPNSFGTDGANLFIVTNSNDEVRSTLTCGVEDGTLGFNKAAILGGNLRYVMTGSDETDFRTNDEQVDDAAVPNFHTGGTVFSNKTTRVYFYIPGNFGSGPIEFAGSGTKLCRHSQHNAQGTIANDIAVADKDTTAELAFEGYASLTFTGRLTGEGTLETSFGHSPTINNNMDMSAFRGTLVWNLANRGTSWHGEDVGIPNGSLVLTNSSINLKTYKDGAEYRPDVVEYGHLVTSTSDPASQTDTLITDQISWKTVTLRVGSLGLDGTYAGSFAEETANSCTIALDKVGAGTWTLNGASLAHRGDTTVSAGRLNIDTAAGWGTSAVTVKSRATLGGTGTVPTAVTVEAGGIIAGSLTLSGGVTFQGAGTIEVEAGQSGNIAATTSTIDASTLTVRLTGELDVSQEYTILTAGSGSSGKAVAVETDATYTKGVWRTKWVAGDGGTKTLVAYFAKPGFVLVIQ